MIKIHFLWWEGCPSHPDAWARLHDVLAKLDVKAEIESIEVTTDEQAETWHFPGSPTIQVNGADIDPAASDQSARLTCRLYFKEDGRPSPLPSAAMIKRAILQAAQ
ncbi:MAG: DUF2703 domain-containing protein [Anaerolineae bacterium]|nr:DUF2703 domain-containing protein [Anaerolineae bacterium]